MQRLNRVLSLRGGGAVRLVAIPILLVIVEVQLGISSLFSDRTRGILGSVGGAGSDRLANDVPIEILSFNLSTSPPVRPFPALRSNGIELAHLLKAGGSSVLYFVDRALKTCESTSAHRNTSAPLCYARVKRYKHQRKAWRANRDDDPRAEPFRIALIREPCAYYVSVWRFQGFERRQHRMLQKCYAGAKTTEEEALKLYLPQVIAAKKLNVSTIAAESLALKHAKGDTLNISGDTYGNYSLEVLDDLPNRMRESFRLFMQDLHRNSTIGAMTYRSWCSSKTKFPGLPFWDDGQLTRCVRDMPEEKQAEISDSLGDPWEKVYTNVDCWVRTSTLTEDLTKCLLRFEALNPGSVWVDRLARLQGIHRNGGSRDHFEKLSCSDFYDEELRSSVEQRDKQLFESFGYSCCSRDIKPMRYPQGPLRSKPPVHPTAPPPPAATRTTEKDTVASNSAPGDKNRQTKPSGRSSTTPFVYFAPDLPSTRTSMARRGCRNQASVAICLIGDRLEGRKRANLHYHWMKNLIGPLGGAQNVEVIVHASKDDLDSDSFTEILDEWPTAIGIYREDEEDLYTVYQEESKACPGPFLTFSSWMQRLRKRDCYRAIREREMECNHHYRWVVRDQADHFFYKPVFAGGTRTLSSLEEGIHVAGLTRRWMNHRFGIVSRDYAPHYFAAKRGACTHPNATELFTAPCLWDRKVDAKSPASRVDPGCDLVMGITHELGQQHAEGSGKGRAVGHFVRGKTVTRPLLVRGCEHDECDVAKCNSNPTCKMKVEALREAAKNDSDATARMMKVLDRSWVVCEQEVPGSHAACAPPFY